jgi:uncharacterized ion transporter superfamily protein YfcC
MRFAPENFANDSISMNIHDTTQHERGVNCMSELDTKKRSFTDFKVPHVYVIVFFILLLALVCTVIVPSGEYSYVFDENAGRDLIDPSSYNRIEKPAFDPMMFVRAIPAGMNAAVDVIMMVVLILAAFEIVNATGALTAGIYALVLRLKGKESLVVAGLTVLFSVIGGFLGWAEGILMFIPLAVSMTKAMGYDALLGVGVVMLGGGAGFTAGPLNVYTTGVAQGIASLPLFSGLEFRLISWGIFTLMAIVFCLSYARKLKKDINNSLISGQELSDVNADAEIPAFTLRRKINVVIVACSFILIAYGTAKWGWYLKEISGAFIIMGILCGLVAGTRFNDMALQFANGAKIIIPSALVIGMARGVLYIMQEGKIIDTLVHSLAAGLNGMPSGVSVVVITLFTVFLNFFIISASSKAAMLMPILMPLGDIIGVNRQVITIAYQFGDGFTNYFWPTSGIVMAGLALGGNIPWDRWAKWVWTLMLAWTAVGMVLTVVAQMIQLGPF